MANMFPIIVIQSLLLCTKRHYCTLKKQTKKAEISFFVLTFTFVSDHQEFIFTVCLFLMLCY